MPTSTMTPTRRRWTYNEYFRAAEVGLFRPDERLELIEGDIYREPGPMTDQPLGYHYKSSTRHVAGESVTALIAPNHAVPVADLLP